ncbi:MAG: protoglobin domain-containing protein [Myxococcota bacterium]
MERETDLEERLAFLGLTKQDQRLLKRLEPLLEQHADNFVAAFYRHLLSFAPTRALLSDPAVKERLLIKQRQYLLSLSHPGLDEAYVAQRHRIGVAHLEAGLEPRWYLGAYALYFSLLAPLIGEAAHGDSILADRIRGSLGKVLVLDAQIAMEAYIQQSEEQLEYLNRELAEAGRKLAHDYQEQVTELRHTTHRAEVAEQLASIATLVTGLAHEIGTPMGVIRGHAELLESTVSEERSRWRARTIREQVDRISHIIQTLLNMARPREPVRVAVEVQKLLEDTVSFLSDKFRRRKIEIERYLEDVPSLYGDPDRLQQLFLNLLINAADAMPEGGTLSIGVRKAAKDTVEISIRDTGQGIPADQLSRIFDPFFTTKPAGAGNGLGLVVVKGIVADHDGAIDVKSKPGSGTEFRINLPRGEPQSELSP